MLSVNKKKLLYNSKNKHKPDKIKKCLTNKT